MSSAQSTKDGMNRCPHCGATDVLLDPSSSKLRCQFCRSLFDSQAIESDGDLYNLVGDTAGSGASDIIDDASDVMTFKCDGCSAEVVIKTDESTAARCHWCRHVLNVNSTVPNGAVPDMVLPFSMSKADAEAKIQEFVKKRQFYAHPTFKKEFTTENIMGVYLPYMVVDANTSVSLAGAGEHLVREYTVGFGDNKETYYDADLYTVERRFDLLVDDLTIEASADKINQNTGLNTNNVINAIMPFDTKSCVRWNSNFLRGYASEKRDTNTEELRHPVELQIQDIARFQANKTLDFYDRGVRWDNEKLEVKGLKWKAAYLPVWLYSYMQVKADQKMLHYCAVNARSGKTMGSVPIHKSKLVTIASLIEIVGIFIGVQWFLQISKIDLGNNNYEWIGLAGFTPGFIYYWLITKRYRNMTARHHHEKESTAVVENMQSKDELREQLTRLGNSSMDGANNQDIHGALANNSADIAAMGKQMADLVGIGKMIDKL